MTDRWGQTFVRFSSQSQKFSDVSLSLKQMASKHKAVLYSGPFSYIWFVALLIKILSSPSLSTRAQPTTMVILIDGVDSKGEAAPGDLGGLPTSTEMQPLGCVWHQFHSSRKAARLGQTFLIPPSFHGTSARLRRVDVPSVAFVCAHWGDWWWKLLNGKKNVA